MSRRGLMRDMAFLAAACTIFVAAHAAVYAMDVREQPEPEIRAEQLQEISAAEQIRGITKMVEAEAEPCPLEVSTFWDVPLSEDLQAYIVNECSAYEIDPTIILAMIGRESKFDAGAVGDDGRSFGLMQIMEHYHKERMERLGAIDLLNPYDNVTVGIDYLGELLARYDGDIEMALVAYNMGPTGARGICSTQYSRDVLAVADAYLEGGSSQ